MSEFVASENLLLGNYVMNFLYYNKFNKNPSWFHNKH